MILLVRKYVLALVAALFVILFSAALYAENHLNSLTLFALGNTLLLFYALLTIASWIAVSLAAWHRNLQSIQSRILGALILTTLPVYGSTLNDAVSYAIDYCRLYYNHDYYMREVRARLARDSDSGIIRFDWGGGGFLSTNFFFTLVFDESGDVGLLSIQASEEWKRRISSEDKPLTYDKCRSRIVHLRGRFYSISTVCS